MNLEQINYITSVIGALALKTGRGCSELFVRLNSAGIIDGYLSSAYDVLHTFSLDYVAEDIINIMNKKGMPL